MEWLEDLDQFCDTESTGPLDSTEASLCRDAVRDALDTLSEKESEVVTLRFGLRDGREHTLQEVADIYGVTRERIRQIEDKALKKLGHPMRGKSLSSFALDPEVLAAIAE